MQGVLYLKSVTSNGGLDGLPKVIDLGDQNKRNQLKNVVENEIKEAEKKAEAANKAAQKQSGKACFEGAAFGVTEATDCPGDRIYQNTYISRVNYQVGVATFICSSITVFNSLVRSEYCHQAPQGR